MNEISRRNFLKTAAATGGVLAAKDLLALDLLLPVLDPLGDYPYRKKTVVTSFWNYHY